MSVLRQNLCNADSFQRYISDFQLCVAQAGITDNMTIINNFARGLDPSIITMILSMKDVPTDLNEWIEQVNWFHAQQCHITGIHARRGSAPLYGGNTSTT